MYQSITNLTIETSNFCNARCKICPNENLKYRKPLHLMPLQEFEKILELFPNLSSIALCGCYEPLSDNRLQEIFNIIKKINPNMNITIFSNGSLLTNKIEDILLNNTNLSSIIFSVHGFSSEIYNKIMVNLDRDITYNNIISFIQKRNKTKSNLKISVSFVRTKLNIHEFEDFKKFWEQHKADYIHNFELMNWNNQVLDYENLIEIPKIKTRPCPMYNEPMVIDAYGNVIRCCYNVSFSYGNVFKDGILKYLSKKRMTNTYPDFDCIKCDGWKI